MSFIFYTRVLFTFETQKKKSEYNEIVFNIPQKWKNLGIINRSRVLLIAREFSFFICKFYLLLKHRSENQNKIIDFSI